MKTLKPKNLNGAVVDKVTMDAFRRGYAGYDHLL